jgi:NAD-dependent SIR2 family protein deacetylase
MSTDVMILGAGFSKALGAPMQREILQRILKLDVSGLLEDEKSVYLRSLEKLKQLLSEVMFLSLTDLRIDLEDIYTPLDNSIFTGSSFRQLSAREASDFRKSIDTLISLFMKHSLENISSNDTFCSRLATDLTLYKTNHKKSDRLSFITTNWDILLDTALFNAMGHSDGQIDYCCHTVQFRTTDQYYPGLMADALGKFRVKILKLHGSMNWLHCPRCGRLYTTFDEKISILEYLREPRCRICAKNFGNSGTSDGGPILENQLLMPTFLKEISNAQLKLVWQNAAIELSEAKNLYFIGYSFPSADFELRTLLSRNVSHSARIFVVNMGDDKELLERYKKFFGKRKVSYLGEGAEHFVDDYRRKNLTSRST